MMTAPTPLTNNLQRTLDLLRTGCAPDAFGMSEYQWLFYKCHKAAGELSEIIENIHQDYAEIKRKNLQLRVTLEQVEWEWDDVANARRCPWCEMYEDEGHADDCRRQLALER